MTANPSELEITGMNEPTETLEEKRCFENISKVQYRMGEKHALPSLLITQNYQRIIRIGYLVRFRPKTRFHVIKIHTTALRTASQNIAVNHKITHFRGNSAKDVPSPVLQNPQR